MTQQNFTLADLQLAFEAGEQYMSHYTGIKFTSFQEYFLQSYGYPTTQWDNPEHKKTLGEVGAEIAADRKKRRVLLTPELWKEIQSDPHSDRVERGVVKQIARQHGITEENIEVYLDPMSQDNDREMNLATFLYKGKDLGSAYVRPFSIASDRRDAAKKLGIKRYDQVMIGERVFTVDKNEAAKITRSWINW